MIGMSDAAAAYRGIKKRNHRKDGRKGMSQLLAIVDKDNAFIADLFLRSILQGELCTNLRPDGMCIAVRTVEMKMTASRK
jgi:hypothetical protein